VFTNRESFTQAIHGQVKEWVEANIGRWMKEKPDWFKIELIPDRLLPTAVFMAVGGLDRERGLRKTVSDITDFAQIARSVTVFTLATEPTPERRRDLPTTDSPVLR